MTSAASREDFIALAASFGVDPTSEPFLIPLLRQFCYTPLPPGWRRLTTPQGEHEEYVHSPSGDRCTSHPARAYFEKRLQDERTRHHHEEAREGAWVELYGLNGESSFHDLSSGATRQTPAPQAMVTEEADPEMCSEEPGASTPWDRPSSHEEGKRKEWLTTYMAERWPWMRGSAHPPNTMVFRGWFQEAAGAKGKLVRRELTLEFHWQRGEFVVQLSGSDKEYVLSHLPGKHGLVTELDLHVGAVIQLLGKPIELKQANLETTEWIRCEASRLDKLEEGLIRIARKYGVHSTLNGKSEGVRGGASSSSFTFRALPNPASIDLRQRHIHVEQLYLMLFELRPKQAEAWRAKAAGK